MNPFSYVLHELELDNSRSDHIMALRYLLSIWAALDDGSAFDNGYAYILEEIATLPKSPLTLKIQSYMEELHRTRSPFSRAGI